MSSSQSFQEISKTELVLLFRNAMYNMYMGIVLISQMATLDFLIQVLETVLGLSKKEFFYLSTESFQTEKISLYFFSALDFL